MPEIPRPEIPRPEIPRPEIPHALLVRALPGRVRLRLPALHGQTAGLARLRERLRALDGVTEVAVYSRTGSVLVCGGAGPEAIAAYARRHGLFDVDPHARDEPVSDRLANRVRAAEGWMERATGGLLGLAGAVSLAFVALAAVQAARGKLAGPAVSLLWYAFSALLMARAAKGMRFI